MLDRMLRTLAVTLLTLPAAAGGGGDQVSWRGKTHALEKLPPDLDAAARSALLDWRPFAKECGYRFDLESKGRVLVLSPVDATAPERTLDLVARTVELFEAALPVPERHKPASAAAPEPKSAPTGAQPLPEDPEEAPVGAPPKPANGTGTSTAAAAKTDPDPAAVLDKRTAVLLCLRNGEDYEKALDFAARLEPYLVAWLEQAKQQSGFTLERPLCGGMVLNQPDQEEWNPDNEAVNRCMQLLVLRRFGTQPYWLAQGLAWYAEFGVQKSVYCFPYRTGFVGIGEHTDWDKELASRFDASAKEPVAIEDFAGLKRGTWDAARARTAWGVADYLARTRPRDLAALLEDLRFEREIKSRRHKADGTWERIPDYELPLADQKRIFVARLGPKTFAEMTEAWRKAVAGHD